MPKVVVPDVTIIGLGNWGTSLANACIAADVPVCELVVRERSKRRGAWPVAAFEDARLDARILWLCVRDGEIAATVAKILERRPKLRGQIILHSSGALSVEALAAAKQAGARVASAAPVMSFPTRAPVPLKDVLFAVEAEGAARREIYRLLRKLDGKPFAIESSKKPLYHAAATMTSPLLVSELSAAIEVARFAGLPRRQAQQWVESLATATVRNVFARGLEKSFSGAFARGDAGTILLHLRALAPHPILAEVYRSLARHAVERLPVKNRNGITSILKGAAGKKQSRVRH